MRGLVWGAVVAALLGVAFEASAVSPMLYNHWENYRAIRDSLGIAHAIMDSLVLADSATTVSSGGSADTLTLTSGGSNDTLTVNKGTAVNAYNTSSTLYLAVKLQLNGSAADTVRLLVPPLAFRKFEFADIDKAIFFKPASGSLFILRDAEAKK